jgi:hypothetical protein
LDQKKISKDTSCFSNIRRSSFVRELWQLLGLVCHVLELAAHPLAPLGDRTGFQSHYPINFVVKYQNLLFFQKEARPQALETCLL